MPNALERLRGLLFILLPAIAVACCAFWQLQEDDIFWQLRAGEEILHTMRVPSTDAWSYTAFGAPWINYQWLSQVIFYVAHSIGGVDGLIVFRVVLLVALFSSIGLLFKKANASSAFVVFAPLLFVGMIFRMHLRPETFGLVIFALMLATWPRLVADDANEKRRARVFNAVALWIWANLHGGTAVFGLALNLAAIVAFESENKERLRSSAASLAVFFATPIHFKIITALIAHANYNNAILVNTEWLAFSPSMLDYAREGWAFLVWAALTAASLVAMVLVVVDRWSLPSLYGRKWLLIAIGLTLTVLAFARIRCIPYQLIFVSPLLALIAQKLRKASWVLAVFAWAFVLPTQLSRAADLYGFGIRAELYSPALLEVVRRERPEGRLFTTFEVGSLQLWMLRDYPVYADPRDKIYDPIKAEYVAAFRDPRSMQSLVDRYEVNTVILDYPEATMGPDGNIISPLAASLASDTWAVVAFDRRKALLLRRTSQNARIIDEHEFRLVTPVLPPTFGPFQQNMDAVRKERFDRELERCLGFAPHITYCELVKAATLIRSTERADWQRSVRMLVELADRERHERVQAPYEHLTEMLLNRAREKLASGN